MKSEDAPVCIQIHLGYLCKSEHQPLCTTDVLEGSADLSVADNKF